MKRTISAFLFAILLLLWPSIGHSQTYYNVCGECFNCSAMEPSSNPCAQVLSGGSLGVSVTCDPGMIVDQIIASCDITVGALGGATGSATVENVTSYCMVTAGCYNPNPTVTCSGSGGSVSPASQTVSAGGSASCAITCNSGLEFLGYGSSCGSGTGTVSGLYGTSGSFTATDITASCGFSLGCGTPSPTYYTVTPSFGTGGVISPGGTQDVQGGSSVTFTITADSGYGISQVTVDGVSQGAISSYTFSDVTASHTISATFSGSGGSGGSGQGFIFDSP